MKIVNPSDEQLNAAFAEKVAGWKRYGPNKGEKRTVVCRLCGPERGQTMLVWKDGLPGGCYPNWAKSADAVLPWLEKYNNTFPCQQDALDISWSKYRQSWHVSIAAPSWDDPAFFGADKSFAKAAVIALLRAHGVEVEFTEIMGHEDIDEASDSVTGAGDK